MPNTIRRLAGATAVAGLALSLTGCNKPGTGTTTTTTTTKPATTVTKPASTTTTKPATTTTKPASSGCGSAVLCDNFENQTGTAPSGLWSVAPAKDCGSTPPSAVTIDRSKAHSGSASLRIAGGQGYCAHIFATPAVDVAGMGSVRHVRFYVTHSTALPPYAHVTFLAMHDRVDNRDLRMGGQNGALQFNRESNDATLPEQSPAGVAQSRPLATDRWTCVEVRIDSTSGQFQTWVDGAVVPGLTADGVATHDLDGQWVGGNWRPQLTDLRLGWESYGEGVDTMWFDDVALSTSRIGC